MPIGINKAKFNVGDLVLFKGGLFRIERIRKYETNHEFEKFGLMDIYDIGDLSVTEEELSKADWRDETRILKRR